MQPTVTIYKHESGYYHARSNQTGYDITLKHMDVNCLADNCRWFGWKVEYDPALLRQWHVA